MIIIKILRTKARSFGFHKRSRSVVLKHKWFCPQGDIRGSRDTTQIVMRAEGREGVAGQQRIEVMDADQHLQCRKKPRRKNYWPKRSAVLLPGRPKLGELGGFPSSVLVLLERMGSGKGQQAQCK